MNCTIRRTLYFYLILCNRYSHFLLIIIFNKKGELLVLPKGNILIFNSTHTKVESEVICMTSCIFIKRWKYYLQMNHYLKNRKIKKITNDINLAWFLQWQLRTPFIILSFRFIDADVVILFFMKKGSKERTKLQQIHCFDCGCLSTLPLNNI